MTRLTFLFSFQVHWPIRSSLPADNALERPPGGPTPFSASWGYEFPFDDKDDGEIKQGSKTDACVFPGSDKARNCRSVSDEGVTERMAPTPETGPEHGAATACGHGISRECRPQLHGTATICDHRNSRECRPSVTWYSYHLRPQKFQGPQTLRHMVQPPSMAMEIPGNTDPHSHGTATTYGHGNSREHRHQLRDADTTCSHRNSGECRLQSHGAATTCGHGNSGECRPQSLKCSLFYELYCSECGRVSLCAELSIQKGSRP